MLLPRVVALSLLVLVAGAAPALGGDGSWVWPVGDHRVTGRFDLPDTEYSAGHRGIDLPGRAGEPVSAVAPGRVTFAGRSRASVSSRSTTGASGPRTSRLSRWCIAAIPSIPAT